MVEQVVKKTKVLDLTTLLGISLAFGFIGAAIYIGGNVQGFMDTKSFLIVVLGTFAVTMASYSLGDVLRIPKSIFNTIFYRNEDIQAAAYSTLDLLEIVRRDGLLSLEKHEWKTRHNRFLKDGARMLVDNSNAEEMQNVLNYEIEAMLHRHDKSVSILRKAAEVAPSMGLIGTLIGLVQMLSNLKDSDSIGPAMAVALLTTFYGAILAYMFFQPLASKLEKITADQLLVSRVYVEGLNAIAKKENPRKLELILNSILPPDKRVSYHNYRQAVAKPTPETKPK